MKKNQIILIFILAIVTVLSFITSISVGSYNISFLNFLTNQLSEIERIVLIEIRIPRVILAGFVGGALAVSGASLQGIFRNPLAEPGLIGVSAGAALGAATAIVIGSSIFPLILVKYMIPVSAMIGSLIVIILLFIITKNFGYDSVTYLLLSGIAINAFVGVGIGLLTYISDESELRGLTFWTMGSFGGANLEIILPSIIIILLCMIWKFNFSRKLDIIQLGENEAYRLGINVKRLKIHVIVSSAVIVGSGVSLAGMIGFVGLIVPHMVRIMCGNNHNYVLKGSTLLGASLMMVSDMLCRIIIEPAELPVGLITSALGAPFFLWLIFKLKNNEY